MPKPIRILLQTTIPATEDDWHVGRFSLLRDHLASLRDETTGRACEVVARNREPNADGHDPVLSELAASDFDELWLFAVDAGNGLSEGDCAGITKFRQRGGGILATRDHMDLGSSICTLGGVGAAHYFHTQNLDPDESRHAVDDTVTSSIKWPNYHSGSNGDYQKIIPAAPVHELLRKPEAPGVIEYFPSHPHEGSVGAPPDDSSARVIARGTSLVTDRQFNLVVAFERSADDEGRELGRAVAESSFHHYVDYNWDVRMGCPTFLEEPPGHGIAEDPAKLSDVKTYVRNLAFWLAPASSESRLQP